MADDHQMLRNGVAKSFRVKPKLKPTLNKTTPSLESKYWRSFKSPPKDDETQRSFAASINAIAFSPNSPHDFAVTHSASVSIFSSQSLQLKNTISSGFSDIVTSVSFRSDSSLLAAGDLSGSVRIFDVGSRNPLRRLRGHSRAVRVVRYPRIDKLHLFSCGDDAVVKCWDIIAEKEIHDLVGHKDYVRCGDVSPVSDDLFVSGSYDHTVKFWDIRFSNAGAVKEINHGKPVEDVIYLPSGGLVATAGGNSIKIWDMIGGGRLLHSSETHNKTVTSLCVGKYIGKRGTNEEAHEYRILSVGLDGYMKVFDYNKLKITHSIRFPNPLLSIGFSPDSSTRVIGTSNGTLYIGKKKTKESKEDNSLGLGPVATDARQMKVLKPSYFRYFHRGQNEKPSESDHLITRPKKVKLAEHDKLLNKFRHKLALIAALNGNNGKKNPEHVMAVMEELVSRKKLITCITNLDRDELGLLLAFLQRYSTMPRYAPFMMSLSKKVIDIRGEEIRSSDKLRGYVRNLKRDVVEEIQIQQSLQEIQGIISPLLRVAVRR